MHTSKNTILKLENISSGYGKKQVLFDVSFEVDKGEVVLLAGSNGSGKSTLLKAIYGILPIWNSTLEKHKGRIILSGEDITGKPTSTLLKKGLLYIPQKDNLFEDLTVKENLEMAGLTIGRNQIDQRIENALSIYPILEPHLGRIPMNLSGGERQLLTLAMAVLHQPKMILVDEPFAGLSPQNIAIVTENVKALSEKGGVGIIIVEHRVKECLRLANKMIGLKFGRVFSRFEMATPHDINDLYGVFL